MDFDPDTGSEIHWTNGQSDAFWSMFDSSGNFVKARTWGGADYDEPYSLCVTDLGSLFVVGYYDSVTVEFAPVGAPCFADSDIRINSQSGYDDAFLVKYLPDGCW